jgi:hypothetical protein
MEYESRLSEVNRLAIFHERGKKAKIATALEVVPLPRL